MMTRRKTIESKVKLGSPINTLVLREEATLSAQ
jgi:hypothetical protein